MKKLFVVFCVFLLTGQFVFGKGSGDSSSKKPRVAFICKSYADAFCVWNKDEAERLAKEKYAAEFDLISFDAGNNSNTQINQIENCIASGFDVIIFQQVDVYAQAPAVQKAVSAGIPVIVTVGQIEDGGASTYVDVDPFQQGYVVAKYAITKLPQNAKVTILMGPAGNFHANSRQEGFLKALGERKDIQIIDQQIGEWQREKGMTITQNWLSSIQDLNGILSHNDDMALGALEAIKMAGKVGAIQIYGVDALAAACLAVKDGSVQATVFQNAVTIAEQTLEFASKALKRQPIASIAIDSDLVTIDNVDTYLGFHRQLGNIK
jgi:inositol transport system substrate-binding protein